MKEDVMKASVAILSAALVALGGGAIHLWRQLDASRHQIADLQAQVHATATSARAAASVATSPSLPLAEPIAAVPAATPTATSKEIEVRKEIEELLAGGRAGISPETIAAMKMLQRGQMSTQYPDVGKVLGLSPDEVERLYDLLTEQYMRQGTNDPGLRAGAAAELASLLGSKYAKWQEYTAELPTRRQVKDLDAVLGAAGTPLSDAQRTSLIPAVAAAERSNNQERAAQYGHGSRDFALSRYSPEANQKLLDAAAAHLTPQQLESYRQMLERATSQQTRLRNMSSGAQ